MKFKKETWIKMIYCVKHIMVFLFEGDGEKLKLKLLLN